MSEMRPETGAAAAGGEEGAKNVSLVRLLRTVSKVGGSDIHLKAAESPRIRLKGVLQVMKVPALSSDEIESLLMPLLSEEHRERFARTGGVDFAVDVTGADRYRINLFKQRGKTSMAARRVNRNIPLFEKLNLPASLLKIADFPDGLVLLAGATGSGKSTTIASIIQRINEQRSCHIVTIEDPIEYMFEDAKAIINQREIGIDVPAFDIALKHLMRQDPDVVLVGEMRDRETFAAAIQAAQTGHLVFSTIHANSAAQTIGRILDLFPPDQRNNVRQNLVFTLRVIVCQMLMPSIQPEIGRVPAVEVMFSNAAVKRSIHEGKDENLKTIIQSCSGEGMQDFTESLAQHVKKELISHEVAYEYAPNLEELKMRLKGIDLTRGGILA
jgi:twitching motility protein PilT